ncbi:MAG: DUF1573 domain-containing protein [Ignavibacteria bacterium]|nr:DUF1573 domain-containing protein [Ignavibacteria bacterium]
MKTKSKILLILLLLIFISNSFSYLISPEPVIKFDDLNYDFGDVKQGENLEHVFKITNSGKGTTLITSV